MKSKEQLIKDERFERFYAEKYGWKVNGPQYLAVITELALYPDEEPVKDGKPKALTVFEYKEGRQ